MASNNGFTRNGLEISRSEFVLESTTDSVTVLDHEWRILYRNSQAIDLLKGRDISIGRSLWEAFPEAFGGPFHQNYIWALEHQKPVVFEEYLESMQIWFEVHAYPSEETLTLFFRDVTEKRRIREQLTYLARHDTLTGTYNRTYAHEKLDALLEEVCRDNREAALLYIDLDHFKEVNDSYGHPFGDALLKAVATRIKCLANDVDILARLGGDEFLLVTRHATSTDNLERLAAGLVEALSAPFNIEDCQVEIGASIGIAMVPKDGVSTEELLRNSDTALYFAKGERNSYRFFDREMAEHAKQRQELKADLARALDAGQLQLQYQPIFHVRSGRLVRFEALLRWQHPERGFVPPSEFIALAEETGQIAAIGDWVMKAACAEAATWPQEVGIAINLSPAQFRHSLPFKVADALSRSGLRPDQLYLEITETVLLQSTEENFRLLEQIHALGVKVALDDFGSGYASLGYLREFPFHEIKIDRTFVADDSLQAYAILDSVTQLGHALGARVTAEGVETRAQLERVRGIGCDKAQGFLLGRPVPATDVQKYMRLDGAPDVIAHRTGSRTGAFRTMRQPVRQTRLSGVFR
ncbi:bifunctional diguanylate cyclase/phosphodiesterase [Methyloceanibacter sp. wino2]|uniref:putative bifunctional diguanylate cyclase/phosphodiesterase n=1 Tax=Methyloceanibacter sp. wino2 TaxID=2170729 RepID=UPI000D3E8766|nr:EAL domain-containing protein [Methyloceanibacter sp. wino2]